MANLTTGLVGFLASGAFGTAARKVARFPGPAASLRACKLEKV